MIIAQVVEVYKFGGQDSKLIPQKLVNATRHDLCYCKSSILPSEQVTLLSHHRRNMYTIEFCYLSSDEKRSAVLGP